MGMEQVKHESPTLTLCQKLVNSLKNHHVRFCHWKSNSRLEFALSGNDDLDVLIHRSDSSVFLGLIHELGFKRVQHISESEHIGASHFFGLDESGQLVHLHAYFQIITGDSILKNYHLPVEALLLENTKEHLGVPTPTPEAELIIYVIRMILKHQRVIDICFLYRKYSVVLDELSWLETAIDEKKMRELLKQYFPQISSSFFSKCRTALRQGSYFKRRLLFRKLKNDLQLYTRFGPFKSWALTQKLVFKIILKRVFRRQGMVIPSSGGAVIAFVGPQATGKSTLTHELSLWLGKYFVTEEIHAGKPPSSLPTLLFNALLPLARKILPQQRTTSYEKREAKDPQMASVSILQIFRFVILAKDRKSLLKKIHHRCRAGRVVFSDRYPSRIPGAIDSRWFTDEKIQKESSKIKKWMMQKENEIYNQIPEPHMVIHLSAPMELAIDRDQTRAKPGPKDPEYVRLRHSAKITPQFEHIPQAHIQTTQSLSHTLLEVKQFLWKHL